MGWSGESGLGAFGQGVKDPIKASEAREKQDMYKGIGEELTNKSDPFESFRRNKGEAFLQRIRDGKRE